ncbi:MAG: hypothetical protein ACPLZH_03585 [Minisyncoccales bacterium]
MAKDKDLIKQAKQLLDDIKRSRKDFNEKTSQLIREGNQAIKELEDIDLDKELAAVEKESIKEMDSAVLDFLSEEGED